MRPAHKILLAAAGLGAAAWWLTEHVEQLRGKTDGTTEDTESDADPSELVAANAGGPRGE